MIQVLLLSFKLQESRIAVVSSTAAATLRQLVICIFDKVVDEDNAIAAAKVSGERGPVLTGTVVQVATLAPLEGGSSGSTPTSVTLHASASDAFHVFEDLCKLSKQEPARFLQLQTLPRTFGLELIESVLTNFHELFRKVRSSLRITSFPTNAYSSFAQ